MPDWPRPPGVSSTFYKAHGLGNDYLVFEEGDAWLASPVAIRRVCDRYRGVGADGIVVLLADRTDGVFRLRMFNPDGSEFERSGNGLRIFGSYLARLARAGARIGNPPYTVQVGGNHVTLDLHGRSGAVHDVSADMGRARTGPGAIGLDPAALDPDGFMAGPNGERLHVVPVSVGNPHLVVLVDAPTDEALVRIGPFLATHAALAAGANVQLAAAGGRGGQECRALIWERGVGRTSASGTSSCAVAVAAVTSGLAVPGALKVRMPGGDLVVDVSADLDVVLRGPVEEICTGSLTDGWLERVRRSAARSSD